MENSPNSETRPVDTSVLNKIVGTDPALHQMLLKKFVASTAESISKVHDAFNQTSAQRVGELGHMLKSSSRAVGANELADLCYELEKAGKAADWDRISELHARLDGVFQTAKDHIENIDRAYT